MPYIPSKHAKYDLLPLCRKHGGEVFSYPCNELKEIEDLIPKGELLIPYGYTSYQEYDLKIDEYISKYGRTDNNLNELGKLLSSYKDLVHQMNIKESWTVVKYIGETMPGLLSLTKGKYYYWPCSKESPAYEGVIDDEEFTSYLYSTGSALWEIAEDPFGMARSTLLARTESWIVINHTETINDH